MAMAADCACGMHPQKPSGADRLQHPRREPTGMRPGPLQSPVKQSLTLQTPYRPQTNQALICLGKTDHWDRGPSTALLRQKVAGQGIGCPCAGGGKS